MYCVLAEEGTAFLLKANFHFSAAGRVTSLIEAGGHVQAGADLRVHQDREFGFRSPHQDVMKAKTGRCSLRPRPGMPPWNQRRDPTGRGENENRFEQESRAFFGRVRNTYLAIAAREPGRVVVVDARGSADATHAEIVKIVRRKLKLTAKKRREASSPSEASNQHSANHGFSWRDATSRSACEYADVDSELIEFAVAELLSADC